MPTAASSGSTRAVVIVSGGLDSVTLLHALVKREKLEPAVITFQYGQKHFREVECARYQVKTLGLEARHLIIDLSALKTLFSTSALVSDVMSIPSIQEAAGDSQPTTYVPNRNLIFLSLAAAYAESSGASDVFYGAQSHDLYGYWDTTPQFLERLNHLLGLNRKVTMRIKAPFVNDSKSDILRLGLALDVDYSQTWSCYEGQQLACGRCPTCAERLQAFEEVGLPDPLPYAPSPEKTLR